ncbi:MAG: mechanosensitive ion channel family protein [Patescibacteria group bacterium]|nr:mechanosensitive ion channel family protein [Patescibacteria group bacterium]
MYEAIFPATVLNKIVPVAILDRLLFTITAIGIAFVINALIKRGLLVFIRGINRNGTIPPNYIKKGNTFHSILTSFLDIFTILVTVLVILSNWQVDISPLLASAGIIGLAASLGSQTLIKDFMAGLFIVSENQFNVGDRVTIDKYTGKVVQMTLRLTILKDDEGNLIYIPNSQLKSVIRHPKQESLQATAVMVEKERKKRQ